MAKYFCQKCGKGINARHRILCDDCKIAEYRKAKKESQEKLKKEITEDDYANRTTS